MKPALTGTITSYPIKNINIQEGEVPQARLGHTLTKISTSEALMLGGLCMVKRHEVALYCTNMFQQSSATGQLYKLSMNPTNNTDNSIKFEPVWKKINNVDTTLERSFHTATFVKSIQSIVVLGGVKYEDGKAVSRYCLGDILFIETENLSSDKVNLKVENLASLKDVFISGHAVTTSPTEDTHIYCFGGYEQNISNYKKDVNPSSNLYVIDVILKQAIKKVSPDIFATACHSLTFIHESTLVILGGTNQSINLFTSKALIPEKCDLASKCVVDESFISPIPGRPRQLTRILEKNA